MNIRHRGLNVFLFLIAGFISFVLLVAPDLAAAARIKVAIIPSSDSIIYTRTIDHIKEVINTSNTNKILFTTISLNDIETGHDNLAGDIDLIIPVGQLALDKTISRYTSYPILATLVSRTGFIEILKKNNALDNKLNIGAIYLDQPLKRHLVFSRLALPKNKRLGFLMSREFKNNLTDFDSIAKKYSYHLEIYNKGDNLIQSLNRVMDDSDVIIALPDPTVFNRRNTHNILLSTYRKFIPLLGFSASYVKAGALAGIHSTPGLIGKQTGEFLNTVSNNGFIGKLPRLYARYFQVSVNNKVGRSLGLPALDDTELKQKLLDNEGARED